VGALVAAGMPVPKMTEVMRELDYRRFRDAGRLGPLSAALSLLTRLGLFIAAWDFPRYLATYRC
jgi:hypothetical protein